MSAPQAAPRPPATDATARRSELELLLETKRLELETKKIELELAKIHEDLAEGRLSLEDFEVRQEELRELLMID